MLFKKLRKISFYFFSFIFVFLLVFFSIFYYYGRDLPSELTLLDYSPPTTTKIYSSENELIEEYAIEHRVIVKFNEIPLIVKGAFIIAEDREFYIHSGISVQSLARAIIENTAKKSWDKKPAGGSTITQQIAKNLLVGNARSLSRKIREAIMAFRIESTIAKDKILEIYLNQLYLGKGCYGIVEACNYYFDKPLSKIEPHEAAFLASVPSAPTVYINTKNSAKLFIKRNTILYQMYEMGYINKNQLKQSLSKPIETKLKKHKLSAPYFSDEIFRLFSQHVSKNAFFRNGYSIKTTVNKKNQFNAQKALEDGIIEYTKTTPWNGALGKITSEHHEHLKKIDSQLPITINKIGVCFVKEKRNSSLICETANKRNILINLNGKVYNDAKFEIGDIILYRFIDSNMSYELYQTPEVTGGIVVMDSETGDILAMSGGYSFDLNPFNCITQAMRQPGSTIKPFVYAASLETGKDEYDIIEDKPITITLKNGEKYTPHNYNKKTYGKIYLRDGLIYSRNLATVNLVSEVGMDSISNLLKSMNLIKTKGPISAVLGSIETTPLQILSAFSAFFNNGKMIYPRFVTDINQSNQKFEKDSLKKIFCQKKYKRVLKKETAEIIQNILHDVVKYGTANKLSEMEKKFGITLFGKTGTTNDFKDAWFIGAIKDNQKTYLVCTFIGYPIPRSLGKHCSGAKVALPIFANFVKNFYS